VTGKSSPITCFLPGRHIAANGVAYEFSAADVAGIAARYSPQIHRAPFVKGHPATDSPAFGYAMRFDFAEGKLQAVPADVDQAFADEVRAGRWIAVSMALYPPTGDNNPTPGKWYPRHLGFLGAQAPAVKGMPAPELAESGVDIICFSGEPIPPPIDTEDQVMADSEKKTPETPPDHSTEFAEREAKLAADAAALDQEKAALKRREEALADAERQRCHESNVSFAERLIEECNLVPRLRGGIIAYLDSADAEPDAEVSFAEGDETKKLPRNELLHTLLRDLSDPRSRVDFDEHAGGGGRPEAQDDAEIARRARTHRAKLAKEGQHISFVEAVDAVTRGKED
jgi:hypothetical protein